MKILLLYPEFPVTFWSFKHALQFVHKRASMPPLGLLTVAAMLPTDWELRLVDMNVTALRDEHLHWADCVFVSAMIVQREGAHAAIARCKAAGLPVVAGGPLFTGEWEDFPEVDHFVLNEAELTLGEFLADFAAGRPQRMYTTAALSDMRATPVPRWDLVDLRYYASTAVQYSRGCPFDCEFCNITALYGHRPRVKSADQIVAELDLLYRIGWRGRVFFVDDNLIGNRRRLKDELLPAIIEWRKGKVGMPFNTEASINLADDSDLMQLMVEAGFDGVFIGIETPEESSLAECNKKQNRGRDLLEDVKRIQRAGLEVQGGFILGFDSDTLATFQRQIDFIQRSGIVTAMVGLLQALPATRLYDRMARDGRLQGASSGNNVEAMTNIVPVMDPQVLFDGYKSVLAHLYAPKHYYERVITFLRELEPPKFEVPIDGAYVAAFLRSVVRLGIFGEERGYYWRLVRWTLAHRPRLFPQAITLAIYGYHFRRVCEMQQVL
jgi:radical SAM superfamily enzyme YgiQ (UPF0313 family)